MPRIANSHLQSQHLLASDENMSLTLQEGDADSLSEVTNAHYALYTRVEPRLVTEHANEATGDAPEPSESPSLQLVTSTLSLDQENLLQAFLIRRLRKGAIYTGTGAFSGMDFSLSGSGSSPAVCYYILLPCGALVCLLAMAEDNLEVFRSELASFCEGLAPLLQDPSIRNELATWQVVCLQYIGRVLKALGTQVSCLLQLAQQNRGLTSAKDLDPCLAADVNRFLSACAVAECLGSQPGINAILKPADATGKLQVNGVQSNMYCNEWARMLLEHSPDTEPWRLRKVLEAFKLKTIKDMNVLKRLLKLSETDHYSLYRACTFLWQSGNSDVLLHQAALEGGSSHAVLVALQDHLTCSTCLSS